MTGMPTLGATAAVPAHVPEALISSAYPFVRGRTTERNPYDLIAGVHAGPRVIWSPTSFVGVAPSWVPRRAEDLRAIYQDHEHYSSAHFSPFAQLLGEDWALVPVELDPPMHKPYRMMMNPMFTPAAIARLDERIRNYARGYVAAFRGRGHCEFMVEFAFEFPIRVFIELMGLPQELTPQFVAWETSLLRETDVQKLTTTSRAVVSYLREQIRDRQQAPREDLISLGVRAEVEGRRLSEDELVGFCLNLYLGGLDTVSTNLGLQMRHLAENPEHQRRLRDDPSKIPGAMEEMLRAYAAVTTWRTCIKQTRIGDVTVLPGDKVAMSTYLGCRDPEEIDQPHEVRLDRAQRHLGFGYGPHICVGMHLARRELRLALEELLAGLGEFRIVPGAKVVSHLGPIIQPQQLPLQWNA